MGRNAKIPVKIVWTQPGTVTSYGVAVFFNDLGHVTREFSDYMLLYAKKGVGERSEATYKRTAYALKEFQQFLSNRNIKWNKFTDVDFDDFIRHSYAGALEEQIRKTAARHEEGIGYENPQAVEINLNFKIDAIYNFYEWAQDEELIEGWVGVGCPIHTITSATRAALRSAQPVEVSGKTLIDSAALIGRTGAPMTQALAYRPRRFKGRANARSISDRHFATDEEVVELLEHLTKIKGKRDAYAAARDGLYVTTLWTTAFRRGSTASLTVDDFPSMEKLEKMDLHKKIAITPAVQKGGGRESLEVERQFAIEVRKFIDGPRAALLKKLGLDKLPPNKQDRHLFLSTTSGKGMDPKSLGDIVVQGFRDIGIEFPRTGSHAIRRGKADAWILQVLREYKDDGPRNKTEVLERVSAMMFHRSKEVLHENYRRVTEAKRSGSAEWLRQQEEDTWMIKEYESLMRQQNTEDKARMLLEKIKAANGGWLPEGFLDLLEP